MQKEILENVKLTQITPYERNARKNDQAVKEVVKSIERTGYRTPIIVDENNIILAGHTRYKAIQKLGWKEIPFVVKYLDLDEKQKQEYRIRDNKAGEFAEWDFEILEADFTSEELVDFGFDIKDLTQPEVIEDEAPPLPEIARTVKGDIYTLGNHRVMCGDSSMIDKLEDLLKGDKPCLCFTDPPYGVSIGKKNKFLNSHNGGNSIETDIEGDDLKPEDLKQILVPIMSNMKLVCSEDCSYFVTTPQMAELFGMMLEVMELSGLPARHILMWMKNAPTFSMGRLDYDYQHEPILLTWGKKHKSIMAGEHRTSVWKIDKPRANKEHPTMKPVELYVNALMNNSEMGDIAIDPFGGSGTMVIACEQTQRKAVVIELTEHYTDVIVQRWVNFTGGKVILNGQEIEWSKSE